MKRIEIIYATLCFFICLSALYAEKLEELPNLSNQTILGSDRIDHKIYGHCISSATGDVTIAVGLDLDMNLYNGREMLELWNLDESGKIGQRFAVPFDNRIANLVCLTATSDGALYVIPDQESIVRIEKNGTVSFIRQMTNSSHPQLRLICSLLAVDKSNLLAMGQDRLDGYIMKLDGKGNSLWEKRFDRGKFEVFTSGVTCDDGNIVIVGSSSTPDNKFGIGGPTAIWIIKIDTNGNILSEKMFGGRNGKICKSNEGNLLLAYDKNNTVAGDVWVKILTQSLDDISERKVLDIKIGVGGRFNISPVISGGCVVGAAKERTPWICHLDDDINEAWNYETLNDQPHNFWQLFSYGNQFYCLSHVVHGTIDDDGKRIRDTKISVTKFIQN